MPERIDLLQARVEALEKEVSALREAVYPSGAIPVRDAPQASVPPQAVAAADASEELLQWVGKSALLPRISTLCFLLVLALILRTLTDNGLLDKQVGSLLGMTYAALLISIGWHKYRRMSPLAPVFGVCGAVLMYIIVVETHAHFASLPSVPAYVLLVATGIGMGAISYFHQSALPVLVGSLGMGLAGLAIDYPNPYFPHLAMVLLIANLLGAFATRLQRCSWLRWILLLVTATTLLVWGIKIKMKWGKGGALLEALGPEWFLPVIAVFALVFLGTAVWGVLRWSERVSRFDLALPSVTAVCVFAAASIVVKARWGTDLWLGWLGVVGSLAMLGGSVWLANRRPGGAPGTTAFAVSGTVLALLALPAAFGAPAASLPVVAGLGLAQVFAAERWRNGRLRILSYLTQIYAGGALFYLSWESGNGPGFVATLAVAGSVAGAGLLHFRWCRRHGTADLPIFSRFDPEDRSAILVFLVSLASGFLLLRAVLYEFAQGYGGKLQAVFQGGQSVIINVAAALLMVLAFRRRNREMRNVAILITIVGAARVFIYDLFGISGLPLVLAVFSFGVTISLISVCLPRWVRGEAPEEGAVQEDGKAIAGDR